MSEWVPEPHTLAGAYAMDALDGPDRARFERHMERCEECTGEVAGLFEASARLAAAAAARPPAALREQLLAETARTRQLPPVTHGAPAGAARHTGPAGPGLRLGRILPYGWGGGVRRARGGGVRSAWGGGVRGARGGGVRRVRGGGVRRARAPRLAVLAAVAVLVAVAVWAGGIVSRSPQPGLPPQGHDIAVVLTAPDLTVLTAPVRTGGTATVAMSRRERMLVFAAAGLRALPGSWCYELWLMEPGGDRPAGLLPGPRHGMSGPVVAAGLRAGDHLGLTVEPAKGTRHPTSAMLLVLAL